jgi:hypothetical protein
MPTSESGGIDPSDRPMRNFLIIYKKISGSEPRQKLVNYSSQTKYFKEKKKCLYKLGSQQLLGSIGAYATRVTHQYLRLCRIS